MKKDEVLKLEKKHNLWDLEFKQAKYWDYVRSSVTEQYCPFQPRGIHFGWKDIKMLFVFIGLLFKRTDVLVFIPGRGDMISYSKKILKSLGLKNSVIFVRGESKLFEGNAFFIESIRYLFRITSGIIKSKDVSHLENSLLEISEVALELKNIDLRKLTKNFVGDVYFNMFIAKFFRGKVLYSNCIIPKVERSMRLMDSVEIQHGVIHDEHPDYYSLPFSYNLICYDRRVENTLRTNGFRGKLKLIRPVYKKGVVRFDLLIFTTTSDSFNHVVRNFCRKLKASNSNLIVGVQPHPKDNTGKYPDEFIVYDCSPTESKVVIMPDSTLIYHCINNNKRFYFLNSDQNDVDREREKIICKYGESSDFVVVNKIEDALKDEFGLNFCPLLLEDS